MTVYLRRRPQLLRITVTVKRHHFHLALYPCHRSLYTWEAARRNLSELYLKRRSPHGRVHDLSQVLWKTAQTFARIYPLGLDPVLAKLGQNVRSSFPSILRCRLTRGGWTVIDQESKDPQLAAYLNQLGQVSVDHNMKTVRPTVRFDSTLFSLNKIIL